MHAHITVLLWWVLSCDGMDINRRVSKRDQATTGIWTCFCGSRLWRRIWFSASQERTWITGLQGERHGITPLSQMWFPSLFILKKKAGGVLELFIKHRSTSQMSQNHIFQITLLTSRNRTSLPSTSTPPKHPSYNTAVWLICVYTPCIQAVKC